MTTPRYYRNTYPTADRGVYLPTNVEGTSTQLLAARETGGPFFVPADHKWLVNGWLRPVDGDSLDASTPTPKAPTPFDLALPVLQHIALSHGLPPAGTHSELASRIETYTTETDWELRVGLVLEGEQLTAAEPGAPSDFLDALGALSLSDIKTTGLRAMCVSLGVSSEGASDVLEQRIGERLSLIPESDETDTENA